MPKTKQVAVKKLSLDLKNFRTVAQQKEHDAIHALISIHPDWFWALAESLVDDGYHPTENIIVLKDGAHPGKLLVKEGNRRIAALKLIHGYVKRSQFSVPSQLEEKIAKLPKAWKTVNATVPCAVYESGEASVVDKLVTLTHGKAEHAGRDKWNAVARARHNRDMAGASEAALDLLEKYLEHGKNRTPQQAEQWAGEYPLTVLQEATKRVATRFGVASSRELADQYPTSLSNRDVLEDILLDIGTGVLVFETIRDKNTDFGQSKYGLPAPTSPPPPSTSGSTGSSTISPPIGRPSATPSPQKAKAISADDPRAVRHTLRKFQPKGNNREKLVVLLNEARSLKLETHPHAFCFLLRSMFEISAKAYCADHATSGGPKATKADGDDRSLVDVLRDVTTHLTKNNTDKGMKKALHGAMTELGKSESILSVTSMNQLIHNPKFSVKETHISTLFGNVFPLLEAMNK